MVRKICLFLIGIGFIISLNAQDSAQAAPPETTITGSVDAYYKYDFNNPQLPPYNSYTSFTKSQNSFELGMANVKFEYQPKNLDLVADIGFGQREKEFAYNDNGITQAIKQLYVSYSPSSWLKLTAGSWATHVNWELADAYANRNYSMSYLFTIGPFSHTGVRADITANSKNTFMVGLSNATDYRSVPDGQIKKKFLLAQYAFSPSDKVKLYINYVGGQAPDTSKSNLGNFIITAAVSKKFNVVYNGILASTNQWNGLKNTSGKTWWGSALYLNYDPEDWCGLTLRGEYFNDDNQLNLFASQPTGGNVFSTTLSANFKVDKFILIPELRFDNASQEIFFKNDGSATKSFSSFLVAAVFTF